MLTGEGLWFRHGRRSPWILRGASVRVERGQVVGLRGPSGSGKSTLAAVLAGLRTPEAGRVDVDGRPLASYPGASPVQLVTQRPEVAMDPRWKVGRVLAEAGTSAVPAEAGLVEPGWLDRFPHEISGGELQRVNLARALRARPAYLLADEISSSLDALTQAMLWDRVLAEVRAGRLGVLAISHDTDLLDVVADDVVELGELVG